MTSLGFPFHLKVKRRISSPFHNHMTIGLDLLTVDFNSYFQYFVNEFYIII